MLISFDSMDVSSFVYHLGWQTLCGSLSIQLNARRFCTLATLGFIKLFFVSSPIQTFRDHHRYLEGIVLMDCFLTHSYMRIILLVKHCDSPNFSAKLDHVMMTRV